ncbi:MAG: hypothetical protein HN730_08105 [Bdellovibrionales bacterium]|nr:hypothetical protein [Bdellovibrionales bacterium]
MSDFRFCYEELKDNALKKLFQRLWRTTPSRPYNCGTEFYRLLSTINIFGGQSFLGDCNGKQDINYRFKHNYFFTLSWLWRKIYLDNPLG